MTTNFFTGVRGPAKCPRGACDACSGEHHWYVTCFPGCLEEGDDDFEEARQHPAVKEAFKEDPEKYLEDGASWLQCKHCDAWHPITEEMLDSDEFEFV